MRRYHVTTFGCQMNAHDSERIKGMLESLGIGEATSADEADVVVFNTCTIREKPDTRLAAYLGDAGARKRENPELVIAVGGCYAEAQRERIFELYPFVDVAFGPGSIPHLADWVGAGGHGVARGRFGTHEHFAGHLPAHRERAFQAWVQVSMGCNSKCAYCIVPAVRGREQSRRPGDIVAEVERLAADGVREITLLGQNVNSWGRDLAPLLQTEFGELLRACDAVDGIERIRFTSPHPKDFRAQVIAAMAECAPFASTFTSPCSRGRRASSRRCGGHTRRSATSRSSTGCVTRSPILRSGRTSSSASRGRPSEEFAETLDLVEARALRQRIHLHLLAAPGNRGCGDAGPGARRDQARAARAARRRRAAIAAERNAGAGRQRRGGAGGGSEPNRSGAAARPHAAQHDGQLHRRGGAGRRSCTCEIEGATSTTLRGSEHAAVAA